MSFDLRAADLGQLNSLTKYPSIPTYHALDPANGSLTEAPVVFDGPVVLTEKIDGTNARIICLPGGAYLIGSRGELLLAKGDLIGNPALGIVEALRDVADAVAADHDEEAIVVYFGEVYGGKVTQASKQYTGERRVGFRLFDVARIANYADLLRQPRAAISQWRESGGQAYVDEETLQATAERHGLDLTPRLGEVEALPQTIEEASAFLFETIPQTRSAMDGRAGGKPEGIVARSRSRSHIAKLRFSDYRRTLKRRKT
ncbi:MAG: RNA ligase family protein [Bacteroidota bacterium]